MPKVKYNIKNAHIAIKTKDTEGKTAYGAPIPVPGSVSLSLEPQGDSKPFYADGIEYYKSVANSGYSGDWELAYVPDAIREKILKEALDNNKVLLEKVDVETVEFAFGFQIDGDTKNTRFWFYNCTASRPKTASTTNTETKEPQTDTLTIAATSDQVVEGDEEYYVRAKTTDEVNASVYEKWFENVYIPTFAAGNQAA